MEIPCDNLNCKRTMSSKDKVYTIPLAADWSRTDGAFCSLECALLMNAVSVSPARMTGGWKQREAWMREEYAGEEMGENGEGWVEKGEKK